MDKDVSLGCLIALAVGLLLAVPAHAHDGDHDAWFEQLVVPNRSPYQPMRCCSGGKHDATDDCKEVRARRALDGHWEAWIDSATYPDISSASVYGHAPNDWVRVPADAIIPRDKASPFASAIACWFQKNILCFVEPVET